MTQVVLSDTGREIRSKSAVTLEFVEETDLPPHAERYFALRASGSVVDSKGGAIYFSNATSNVEVSAIRVFVEQMQIVMAGLKGSKARLVSMSPGDLTVLVNAADYAGHLEISVEVELAAYVPHGRAKVSFALDRGDAEEMIRDMKRLALGVGVNSPNSGNLLQLTADLAHVAGCYLHQDFDLDAGGSTGRHLARRFLQEQGKEDAMKLMTTFVEVLARTTDNESVDQCFMRAGSCWTIDREFVMDAIAEIRAMIDSSGEHSP